MRMTDIIHRKREKWALSEQEIQHFISEFTAGKIPDYQTSALLMAIYFNGMNREETAALTMAMVESGDQIDLSSIQGLKIDKHSTGGVGDKTTLIVVPIAAACGVKVAKMSGRGLGFTGGTLDKLESIPGFKIDMERSEFCEIVSSIGCAVVGQTGNLCPADKKLYALRDVTDTVDSMPLIASSIMSKKIAAGADGILLDVKMGSGAFMKTQEDAHRLAQEMVNIGESCKRTTIALLTDMNEPLGTHIGNALEIIEVCSILSGNAQNELSDLSIELAANMIYLGKLSTNIENARKMAKSALRSGIAMQKLQEMVMAQGGDVSYIKHPKKFKTSKLQHPITAVSDGFISRIDAESCGKASVLLGAGRETQESVIDYGAGIVILEKCGAWVRSGQPVAMLYTNNPSALKESEKLIKSAFSITEAKPIKEPIIRARVEK